MKTEELKAMCEKCTHKNPCAVCLVDALIKDDQKRIYGFVVEGIRKELEKEEEDG